MFKKMLKYFFKCKSCMYSYFVGIIAYFVYLLIDLPKVIGGHLWNKHNLMLNIKLTAVAFVFFLFIGYEFFSRARRVSFTECASATRGGAASLALNQFFVIELLSLIFTAIVMAFTVIEYSLQGITDTAFIAFSLKALFFYFFCTDTLAILIAMLLSFINNAITSYILLGAAAVLFSPFLIFISDAIWSATEKINLFPITDIFEIYPNDYLIIGKGNILPLSSHNVSLLLFWLLLVICAISFIMLKNRITLRHIICTAALALSAICLVSFNMPFSEPVRNSVNPQKGYFANAFYYHFVDPPYKHMQYNEPADFDITSMDIDLKIRNQLKASVTIKVNDTSLDDYKFTLSRYYKIKSIKASDGTELAFDREGDYLTVYNIAGNDTLCFMYSGASYIFYSNSQGVFLPAGFAFYPINGFHYVYDLTTQGTIRPHLSKSVPITLNIDYKNKIFSNLDADENGGYSGIADGITVASGFYKEMEVSGCRAIFKYTDDDYSHDACSQAVAKALADNKERLDGKTIIFTDIKSNSQEDTFYEASDHFVVASISAFSFLTENGSATDGKDSPQKNPTYIPAIDMYYRMLSFYDESSELRKCYNAIVNNKADGYDKESTVYILAQKIVEYGDEAVFEYIHGHMMSDWRYGNEVAEYPYNENILVRHIGEKTELELNFEEYEREIEYNAGNQ